MVYIMLIQSIVCRENWWYEKKKRYLFSEALWSYFLCCGTGNSSSYRWLYDGNSFGLCRNFIYSLVHNKNVQNGGFNVFGHCIQVNCWTLDPLLYICLGVPHKGGSWLSRELCTINKWLNHLWWWSLGPCRLACLLVILSGLIFIERIIPKKKEININYHQLKPFKQNIDIEIMLLQ